MENLFEIPSYANVVEVPLPDGVRIFYRWVVTGFAYEIWLDLVGDEILRVGVHSVAVGDLDAADLSLYGGGLLGSRDLLLREASEAVGRVRGVVGEGLDDPSWDGPVRDLVRVVEGLVEFVEGLDEDV